MSLIGSTPFLFDSVFLCLTIGFIAFVSIYASERKGKQNRIAKRVILHIKQRCQTSPKHIKYSSNSDTIDCLLYGFLWCLFSHSRFHVKIEFDSVELRLTHGLPWFQYPSVIPSAHCDSSGSSGSGDQKTFFADGGGDDGSRWAHHKTDCGQPMLKPYLYFCRTNITRIERQSLFSFYSLFWRFHARTHTE